MAYVYGDLERQQRERELANMQMAALAAEAGRRTGTLGDLHLQIAQRQQAMKDLEARDQIRQRMLAEMMGGGVSGSPEGRGRSSTADFRMQALAELMDDPSLQQVPKYIDVNNPERKADLGKNEDGPLTIDIRLNPKWVEARKARTEAIEKMLGQRATPSPSTPPPSALADYNERLATVLSAKKDMEDALARTKPLISTWGNFDSTDLKNEQDAARRKYEQALKGFEAMAPGFRAANIPVDDTLARLRGEDAQTKAANEATTEPYQPRFKASSATTGIGTTRVRDMEKGGGIEISMEPEKPAPKAATGRKRLRVLKSGERILATDEELEEFRKASPARRRKLLEKLKAD